VPQRLGEVDEQPRADPVGRRPQGDQIEPLTLPAGHLADRQQHGAAGYRVGEVLDARLAASRGYRHYPPTVIGQRGPGEQVAAEFLCRHDDLAGVPGQGRGDRSGRLGQRPVPRHRAGFGPGQPCEQAARLSSRGAPFMRVEFAAGPG